MPPVKDSIQRSRQSRSNHTVSAMQIISKRPSTSIVEVWIYTQLPTEFPKEPIIANFNIIYTHFFYLYFILKEIYTGKTLKDQYLSKNQKEFLYLYSLK